MRATTAAALIVALTMVLKSVEATDSSVPFINADQVHALGITGEGVTVAVIDSGIDYSDHGLIGGIASGGISYVNGVEIQDGGADPYYPSHGTFMSLIITDSTGVAPDALILPVRVNLLSDVELAIQYVTDRRQTVDPSIRVINLSLGTFITHYLCYCNSEFGQLASRVSAAGNAGIITFAATGNEAECGGMSAPACVSAAVRVAADYDDYYDAAYFDPPADCMDLAPEPWWVTCFSNVTEDCDWFLAAPGYDIGVGSYWGHGTSASTAHCSGVAALMFERGGCPLTAWQARSIIFNTAYDIWWAWPYCPLPPAPRHVDALAAVLEVPPWCLGDIDGDGDIDLADLAILMAHYGMTVTPCTNGDLDGDGDVDLSDLAALLAVYGTTCE